MGGFTPPIFATYTTHKPTFTPTYLPYSAVSLVHVPLFLLLPSVHPSIPIHPEPTAGWVAASRVVDNMHSPADVLCGACIGAAAAAFSYCRSFGKCAFGNCALHFPVREYSEYP